MQAVSACTTAPFRSRHWHWAAVLVIQRLVMVSVSVFVNIDVGVSIGVMLISIWFLLFQLQCQPYRLAWVNSLASIACMCLVTLTVLNSAAPVFVSVGFDPVDTPLQLVQDELEILMLMLLFLPPLFWLYHLYRSYRGYSTSNNGQRSTVEQQRERNNGEMGQKKGWDEVEHLQAQLIELTNEKLALVRQVEDLKSRQLDHASLTT
jgi:hypothetical protein